MSEVQCGECDIAIDESPESAERSPCPACGSLRRCINVSVVDHIELKEMLGMKAKNPAYPGKQGIRIEQLIGDDLHRKSGRWLKKVRIIDRANNYYLEEITDPETGSVVHRCEEPLSQHFGHGSDKRRPGDA